MIFERSDSVVSVFNAFVKATVHEDALQTLKVFIGMKQEFQEGDD